jgi:RNA polymerase subunit RPABC4/transcription elongation factor Spt4
MSDLKNGGIMMVNFTCPDCKKKVSEKAEECPSCGRKFTHEEILAIIKSENNKGCLGCGFFIMMLIFLGLIFFNSDDRKQNIETVTDSNISQVASSAPATPDEKREWEKAIIRQLTEKSFSKRTNWKKPIDTVEKVESNGLYNNKAEYIGINVNIWLNMDENLTVRLARLGLMKATWNLMKDIFTDDRLGEIQRVNVIAKLTLTDNYGNESIDKVAQIGMIRDVAVKINWDNVLLVDYQDIFNDTEKVWLHPALRD